MKIILFQQHPLEILPPLVSLMRILKAHKHDVYYFGLTDTPNSRKILEEMGVCYRIYPWKVILFREHPCERIWRELTKKVRHLIFRRWAWRQINRILEVNDAEVLIWSQSMISAAILGDKTLRFGRRHIVTLYDLGDEAGKKLSGFSIDALYRSATLIECEYNRAQILMAEKQLEKMPFVLPNKPYLHPRTRNLPIKDQAAAKVVESWGERRVFLYQGALQQDRGELCKLIELLCRRCPKSVVAVMTRENEITRMLTEKYANFSVVPFVAPPHHLEVTSHAHVGLAVYKGGAIYGLSPLNAIYCAPNKIFEYSGFGIPMICNDVPGLRYSVGFAGAAHCLDAITDESVATAVSDVVDHYDDYSRKATEYFDSVDLNEIVKSILNYANGHGVEHEF